jgi:hypothetical protein
MLRILDRINRIDGISSSLYIIGNKKFHAKPQSSQSFSSEYPGNRGFQREFLGVLSVFARE